MKNLRIRDNPEYKYTLGFMGRVSAPCFSNVVSTQRVDQTAGVPRRPLEEPAGRQSGHDRSRIRSRPLKEASGRKIRSAALPPCSYGPEEDYAVIELTYNYGVSSYQQGHAYVHLAVGTGRSRGAAQPWTCAWFMGGRQSPQGQSPPCHGCR